MSTVIAKKIFYKSNLGDTLSRLVREGKKDKK